MPTRSASARNATAPAAGAPGTAAPDPVAHGSDAVVPDDLMIRAKGLSKKFKIYPRPWARLTEWLTAGRAVRHEDFWALRDVSFEVRRGESLGVIGVNGSGKSTLLKILSGAMYPTEGEFEVNGRVLSLLELGTGLNTELTGRQNVVNSSRLLALGPGYAAEKMEGIEAFAELGAFFDRPIRLYSSGMLVRLVFAMFASFDPDVFIVDEALSVGDLYFQQKCARRIRRMLDDGVTLLFVSHDLAAVETLCDRVMVLHGGRQKFLGDKQQGVRLYYTLVGASLPGASESPLSVDEAGNGPATHLQPEADATGEAGSGSNVALGPTGETERATKLAPLVPPDFIWHAPDTADDAGDGRVAVTGVSYRREDGEATQIVSRGQWLDVFVRYEAKQDVGPVNGGLGIYDRFNQLLFAVNWLNAEIEPLHLRPGQLAVGRFRVKADLEPGEYAVWLGASQPLRDPESPTGWNQHLGGQNYAALPRGGKIAVLPRADKRRGSFGPANLQYELERRRVEPPPS